MAVFRMERTHNFTVMSNYHLRDKNLSLKAKGLLSQMLSLPEDWDYTLAGLASINAEGRDAIRAAVVELEKAGYVRRRQTTQQDGKFGVNEYIIREHPEAGPRAKGTAPGRPGGNLPGQPPPGNPAAEEPPADSAAAEKPTQIKKDSRNKEDKITDLQSTESFSSLVVTSSASLASPQAAKLARCAVPPLPTKTAPLGFPGGPVAASPAPPVCGGDPEARPPEVKGRNRTRRGSMSKEEMDGCREMIRENIGYGDFVRRQPWNRDRLDEMVELMVEAVCSRRETLRVAGNDLPQAVVKSRLLKLDGEHIRFVFDCLRENTTQVRSMKQYLLTVLYNAPATIENHYAAQVGHDLGGGGTA